MFPKEVDIEIYNPKEEVSQTIPVEQLSTNIFRALGNDIFSQNLTFGTEFETQKNKNGQHEVVRILKASNYITKRFILTSDFKESEYRLLGDEITKIGGFWQVDFGSLAIINIPKEQEAYIQKILDAFNIKLTE